MLHDFIISFPLRLCLHAWASPMDPLYVQRTSLGRVRGTRLPCQLSIWQFACCDARIRIRWVWFGLGLLLITSFFRLRFSFAIYIVKTDFNSEECLKVYERSCALVGLPCRVTLSVHLRTGPKPHPS